jgi:hypothetical protein
MVIITSTCTEGVLPPRAASLRILLEDVLGLRKWSLQRILLAAMATKEATFLGVSLTERRIT